GRREERALPQIARVVHAAVAGRVELGDVQGARAARGQRLARVAPPARVRRGPLHAVERPGEDACRRGLAAATGTGEEVRVVDATGGQRDRERLGDMLLAHDLGEGGGAVLPIEGHGSKGTDEVRRRGVHLPGPKWPKGPHQMRPLQTSLALQYRPPQTPAASAPNRIVSAPAPRSPSAALRLRIPHGSDRLRYNQTDRLRTSLSHELTSAQQARDRLPRTSEHPHGVVRMPLPL